MSDDAKTSGSIQSVKATFAPIVERGGVEWPWSRGGRDLDIGGISLDEAVAFRSPMIETGPLRRTRTARARALGGGVRKAGLIEALAAPVIILLAAFHAAPHLAGLFGWGGFLIDLAGTLPFGDIVEPAARSWAFQPTGVWVIALILRFVGFNIAKKEAAAGLVLALMACALDAVSWAFIGRPIMDDSSALLTLLAVEAGLVAGLLAVARMSRRMSRDV